MTKKRSQLTLPGSAYITPTRDAFATTMAFADSEAFWSGDNSLGPLEIAISQAYDELGRADLGDCVRDGKVFQRLQFAVGFSPSWETYCATVELLTGRPPAQELIEEWMDHGEGKWAGDEGLETMLARGPGPED